MEVKQFKFILFLKELKQENSMLKEMMWKVSGDLDNIRAVIKPFLDEALNPFRNHTLRISRDNAMLPIRGNHICNFFLGSKKGFYGF